MLFYPFKNYEEFKERFGLTKTASGFTRKNKTLLAVLKQPETLVALRRDRYGEFMTPKVEYRAIIAACTSQAQAVQRVLNLACVYEGDLILAGHLYDSPDFRTDEFLGVCQDGDANAIRYVRKDNGRVFKMRAGKMFRHILDNGAATAWLPDSLKNLATEEFVARWQAYASEKIAESDTLTLVVDGDFESIYNSDCCPGDFESCMVDAGFHAFYEDTVEAKAASLRNGDGDIVARCIIYTEVLGWNKPLRLAERQYSRDGDESLKRKLVNALIAAGEIDGYKVVGAGCGDASSFVLNDGTDLSSFTLRIACELEPDDTVSYQDSFKWYDPVSGYAYNNHSCGHVDLATTSGQAENFGIRVYGRDEYYDADEVVYAENIGADAHRDDCIYISGYGYAYAGYLGEFPEAHGVYLCAHCGDFYVGDSDYYSEITGEDYCCESCLERAEYLYKQRNWIYSEYSHEFFDPNEDEAVGFYEEDGVCAGEMARSEAEQCAKWGEGCFFNGAFYFGEVIDGVPACIATSVA